jgi:hypothetical protein
MTTSAKIVKVSFPLPAEESADLGAALRLIDPDIRIGGTAALGGGGRIVVGDSIPVLKIVIEHGLDALVGALVAAIVAWAKTTWFKKNELEVVIYGPDGKVVSRVKRDDM